MLSLTKTLLSFLIIWIILFISLDASANKFDFKYGENVKNWTYKGVAITAYWHSALRNPYLKSQIDYYVNIGVNAIEFTPVWYQNCVSDNEIYHEKSKTVSNTDLEEAIIYAKSKGLKVNLKPHVDPYPYYVETLSTKELEYFLEKSTLEERQLLEKCFIYTDIHPTEYSKAACRNIMENINPAFFWRARINPKDADAWFASYKSFLKHYLNIGIRTNVDLFTVGTELVSMTRSKYLPYWKELMRDLRIYAKKYYSSNIKFTYAAHESELFGTPNIEEREYYSNSGFRITYVKRPYQKRILCAFVYCYKIIKSNRIDNM